MQGKHGKLNKSDHIPINSIKFENTIIKHQF